MMEPLNTQIAVLDAELQRVAETDDHVRLLCTAPQIGPVTASAFASAVDKPERFENGHQVSAYFGLVPSEMSSGEKQRKGRITKAGNTRVRWLLVQAAISIMRVKANETLHLREWATRIAARRGKKTAVVALARKLAGLLFAMLRDGAAYRPPRPQEGAELTPTQAHAA